ncbi:ATP-binding protein [Actinokineospora enzanensis]|uniref:ATP-binding protein n=1 Tax=Actinokineospora enzanensis TaxID=155975 RepID=UPI0003AAFEE0|nr:tetratricopeptide repeat protein [Actinokineospora enzanensis]
MTARENRITATGISGTVIQAHTITINQSRSLRPVPQQLPPVPHGFVGRADQLAELDTPFSVIGGTGGIGKTWLALTWAHRNRDRFPDGQLFVDLHGFSPTGHALPADVLAGFLEALGVDRDNQPNNRDRRSDLFRSLVADKRMLVVLDNALDSEQVMPLLPGGPNCTVVVTSRSHLPGLVCRQGVRAVHLDVLTDAEARALLSTSLGRVDGELVRLCGGFPLALGVIAARFAADPRVPLEDAVAELRTQGLGALDSTDPSASLPTVLSWSLRHLTPPRRSAFALLGIAPGPNIGLAAAAHLTGLSEGETYGVLRALVEASLIDRTPGGRYAMHDLVRAYAISLSPPAEAATRRVLDFYIHTAHTACHLLNPHRQPARPGSLMSCPPGLSTEERGLVPADDAAALAWFDAETVNLIAAQRVAVAHGWYQAVADLAWALAGYHDRRGCLHDRITVWTAVLSVAEHLPPETSVRAHRHIGRAHADLGRPDQGIHHLRHALDLAHHCGDTTQQAHAHRELGRAHGRQGDDPRAMAHATEAVTLFRTLDNEVWEAIALNQAAWCATRLGRHDLARSYCAAALALHHAHDNADGTAAVLDTLGYTEHNSGDHDQAIHHYEHSLRLSEEVGNTYRRADTLDRLGHPHASLGHTNQSCTAWQEALTLYRAQGRPDDAARVQRQLDNLAAGTDRPNG